MRPITYKIKTIFTPLFIYLKLNEKNEKIITRKKDFSRFFHFRFKFPNSDVVKFERKGNSNIYIRIKGKLK